MNKRDFYVIGGAALLGLALLLLSRSGLLAIQAPHQHQQAMEGLSVSLLAAGEPQEAAVQVPLMKRGAPRQPAASYLRVTVGRSVYQPLPLNQDFSLVIRQAEGQYNQALIADGVIHMAEASCPKHECIDQGSLSLDNRDLRAMQSSIICLPNQVVLELLDEGQARAYHGEAQ